MITVYSGTDCPNCTIAMETMLKNGLVFEERNIREDNAARDIILGEGFMSVPVFEKNGKFTNVLEDVLTWG